MRDLWIFLILKSAKVRGSPIISVWVESTLSRSAGPSKAELQLNLLEEEQTSALRKGSVNVLAQGLKIEESQ
jgi:hypothetical protein